MRKKLKWRSSALRTAICKQKENDLVVENGLSLTPARMYEMQMKGMPISGMLLNNEALQYDDGDEVPFQFRRGVGLNEIHEQQTMLKRKLQRVDFEKKTIEPVAPATQTTE